MSNIVGYGLILIIPYIIRSFSTPRFFFQAFQRPTHFFWKNKHFSFKHEPSVLKPKKLSKMTKYHKDKYMSYTICVYLPHIDWVHSCMLLFFVSYCVFLSLAWSIELGYIITRFIASAGLSRSNKCIAQNFLTVSTVLVRK